MVTTIHYACYIINGKIAGIIIVIIYTNYLIYNYLQLPIVIRNIIAVSVFQSPVVDDILSG